MVMRQTIIAGCDGLPAPLNVFADQGPELSKAGEFI